MSAQFCLLMCTVFEGICLQVQEPLVHINFVKRLSPVSIYIRIYHQLSPRHFCMGEPNGRVFALQDSILNSFLTRSAGLVRCCLPLCTKAIDHSFYGFIGVINHAGCLENTPAARDLQTSRVDKKCFQSHILTIVIQFYIRTRFSLPDLTGSYAK